MSLAFPALGFRRDVGRYAVPGRERLSWFLDAEQFSTCFSFELGERLGMVLVDAEVRCWKVIQVVDLGLIDEPFWWRLFRSMLRASIHRLDQQMVAIEPMTLEQVKARAIASIQANPDDWRDDEAIAGEAGPPRDEQEMLDELAAAVGAAQSLPEIIAVLDAPLC